MPRAVELKEGGDGGWGGVSVGSTDAMPQMQSAAGLMGGASRGGERDESPLEFTPREVRMSMSELFFLDAVLKRL